MLDWHEIAALILSSGRIVTTKTARMLTSIAREVALTKVEVKLVTLS